MRARLLFAAAALLSLTRPVLAQAPAPTAPTTPAGLWQAVDDDTKQPTGWFLITNKDGVYSGIIAKMFLKPGEDPNWACDQCEGADRGKPVLGLTLIKGMLRNGTAYENGTIMDPRDGKVYRAKMNLSPDGQHLDVRGYLGISLFGRTQTWNRLPDNALGPQTPAGTGKAAVKAAAPKKQ